MNKLYKIILVILALTLGLNVTTFAGSNTTHGYFYKPSYGEKGPAGYSLYNSALDVTDTVIHTLVTSVSSLATTVSYWVGIQSYQVATYSDSTHFTVPNNLTSKYTPGQLVLLNQGVDGLVANTVVSSSYGSGVTTVTLTTANLTVNLTHAQILNPTATDVVIAADYGTNQAALEAADGVAFAAGKQLIIGIAFPITADCTLTSNLKVMPVSGGAFPITSTKTLTINGTLDAGLYQTFSCTGTGKVVFGAGSVKEVYPQWWGAVADGATDDTPEIQAAIDSIVYGKVVFPAPASYYKVATNYLTLKSNVSIIGDSSKPEIRQTTAAKNVLFGDATSNVEITNLTLTGSGAAIPSTGLTSGSVYDVIRLDNAVSNINIHGNIIKNTNNAGIGINTGTASNIRVIANEVYNFYKQGILNFGDNVWIDKNYVHDCTNAETAVGYQSYGILCNGSYAEISNNIIDNVPAWVGIDSHNGNYINITNNIITRVRNGITIGPTDAVANSGINIIGNTVTAVALADMKGTGDNNGISLVGYSTSLGITNFTISNNVVSGFNEYTGSLMGGVRLGNVASGNVSNNICYNNGNAGILARLVCRELNIIGNICFDNKYLAVTSGGISINYGGEKRNILVANNNLYDSGDALNEQKYGVAYGDSVMDNVVVRGNVISCSTAKYFSSAIYRSAPVLVDSGENYDISIPAIREKVFRDNTAASGQPLGYICTFRLVTTTTAIQANGDNHIHVTSDVGITAGDKIGIILSNASDYRIHWTYVDTIAPANQVNIHDVIAGGTGTNAVDIGNAVYVIRWLPMANYP